MSSEPTPTSRLVTCNASNRMSSAPAPTSPPTQPPKPVNPEPEHEHLDPEKGRVEEPEPDKSEHPTQ